MQFEIADLFSFRNAATSPLAWVAVLLLGAYLLGAAKLWRSRRGWSVLKSVSFALGCVLLFLATGSSTTEYARELVSVLIFQQVTVMVFVPPLLLIGAPGRLLLRATPHEGVGRVALRAALGAYRSKLAYALLNPGVAIVIPIIAFPAFYFTGGVSWVMSVPGGHEASMLLFLLLGVIGAVPLWSTDPLPRVPSYPARLLNAFIEMQVHAVFGLVLLIMNTPLFSWYANRSEALGISPIVDQAIGGSVAWAYGGLPLFIVLIVTLSKWWSRDQRSSRRREELEEEQLRLHNAALAARYGNQR